MNGETREVHGRVTINATGAWSSRTVGMLGKRRNIVRPGKGIHLIYPGRLTNYAVIASAIDGRDIFICPHQNETWIGTTDDDYWGDLDDVPVLADEVEYLIDGIASVLPDIRKHRMMRAIVGCRATLYEYGKGESALSREHEIYEHSEDGAANLYTMAGGKLASYRVMSEEITDLICQKLGVSASCDTHIARLPGGEDHDISPRQFNEIGVDGYTAQRILFRHGSRANAILDLMKREPRMRVAVCPCEPVTEAELRIILRTEYVRSIDDLQRRCKLGLGSCGGACCGWRAAQIFCEEKGLAPSAVPDVARSFAANLWARRQGVLSGTQFAQEELNRAWTFLSGKQQVAHTRPFARKPRGDN